MNDRPEAQAQLMLDAFASVGVQNFAITLTNTESVKSAGRSFGARSLDTAGYLGNCSLEELRASADRWLQRSTEQQLNLHVRPLKVDRVDLVQLDDLAATGLERSAMASFLTLQTSPGNFQAWIAVTGADRDFPGRLRKGAGADRTASGSVRLAGSRNFKTRYAPNFPLVEVHRVRHGCITTPATLELVGLPAPAVIPPRASPPRAGGGMRTPRRWPDYARCLEGAPIGTSGNPKRSHADFTWCVIAVDWGWGLEATAARLLEESSKAKENGSRYALLTAQNAARVVEQRRGARPGPR